MENMSRFNHSLNRFPRTHSFQCLANLVEPQTVGDQLLDRQKAGLQYSHNLRKCSSLDIRAEDGGFVASNRILIQTTLGMLIDTEQNYPSASSHKMEGFRKQTAGCIDCNVDAYSREGLYFGSGVFGLWVYD